MQIFDAVVVGQRVQARRKRLGLSQGALAKSLALRQATVCELERGHSEGVRASTIMALALALYCTSDYLLGLGDITEGKSPEEALAELRALVGHHFNEVGEEELQR